MPFSQGQAGRMEERRKELRMFAGKPAQISFGPTKIPCTVANLSLIGACLQLSDPQAVPDHFDLVFSTETAQRCRVVWRSDKELGVEFVS
jgi:hypothetical protein